MKKIILATMIAVFLILEGSGCGMAKPVSAQEKIISVMKEKYGEEFEFEGWAHKQYGSRDMTANVTCDSFPGERIQAGQEENEEGNKEILGVLPGQLQYPSLNEVNYIAFNEVTEEYHDELYSFIEFQGWKSSYIQGKPTRLYKRIGRNNSIIEEQKVLTEYIRHQIHHPENKNNPRYTREELKQSIDLMRTFIEQQSAAGIVEP